MDYEKKYKEALSKAKELSDSNPSDEGVQKWIQDTFPELRESEDERIRKALIEMVHDTTGDELCVDYNVHKEDALAWLKKNIGISEATKKELEDNLNKALEKETPESWNEFLDEKKPYGQRQECVDCQMNYAGECKGSCAMKRSEQKPAEEYNITGIGSKNAQGKLGEMIKNLTDKFKVGDWVVYQNNTFQVQSLSNGTLILQGEKYQTYFIEELCRLWTVDDARDGDVLAAHECLVLFKKIDGLNIRCYCTYHFMNNESFFVDTLQNKTAFTPATKEQREQLFKAIHEAGYMWDTEGKQLVSLKAEPIDEQKPVWSEEDERIYQSIMDDTVQENQLNDKQTNWLRDIKYRYFPQSQNTLKPSDEHYELEEFAKIVRCNLTGISKAVQKLFEAKYLQLTGNKMYGGFKD